MKVDKNKYVKLLKSGGYKCKDGTIKQPIIINNNPYALREDLK